jgi:hypothetical protein
MDRPSPCPFPRHVEAQFADLLRPFSEAVGAASSLEEIHDALAELRRVESVAEEQRLRLTLNGLEADAQTPEQDRTLDSAQTANYLSRSLDWVYHHRGLLRPALVSPEDSRPRYSTRELDRLRRAWKARQEGA